MKNLHLPFLLIIFFVFQSCYQDTDDKRECGMPCTEEFSTVSVKILNEQDNPVALDSFIVIKVATGEDITVAPGTLDLQLMRENGSYPIINDNYSGPKGEFEVNFKGFIAEEIVADENYIVGKNCCHVYYVSGNLELEIPLNEEPSI